MATEKKGDGCCCPPRQKSSIRLRDIFRTSTACACAPVAGVLLGHAGCVITPLVLAFAGATAVSGATVSSAMMAVGAFMTTGGLLLWEKLRGAKAGRLERRATYIGAVSGMLMSAAFHLAAHRDTSHDNIIIDKTKYKDFISCPPPAPRDSAPR